MILKKLLRLLKNFNLTVYFMEDFYTYKLKINTLKDLFITQINRRKSIFSVNNKIVIIEWIYNENDEYYYCYNVIDSNTIHIHTQKLKDHILSIPWINKRIQDIKITFTLFSRFQDNLISI